MAAVAEVAARVPEPQVRAAVVVRDLGSRGLEVVAAGAAAWVAAARAVEAVVAAEEAELGAAARVEVMAAGWMG